MLYAAFSASAEGMLAQSRAMETISNNIANLNTGGYKRMETNFQTQVGKTMFEQSDIAGIKPFTKNLIDMQGVLLASERNLDLAINGHGFFVLNSQQDGSGDALYGRDGSLQMSLGNAGTTTDSQGNTINYREGYLTDKNGYYIQGWGPDANGNFPTSGTVQSLRIDPWLYSNVGQASTQGHLMLNLPADAATNQSFQSSVSAYDDTGTRQTFILTFTKQATTNSYNLDVTAQNGGVMTAPLLTTPLTFNGDASMATPASQALQISGTFGTANVDFSLDMSGVTQFGGPFTELSYTVNGLANAELNSVEFDSNGYVLGHFSDSTSRPIYRLALASFVNPNGLESKNGNVYIESMDSGPATIGAAGGTMAASFSPNTREMSNVQLDEEFTKMMVTQQAYNSSATVFRTVDEMTQTIRDLKR